MKTFRSLYVNKTFPSVSLIATGFDAPWVSVIKFGRAGAIHIDDFRAIYRKVKDLPDELRRSRFRSQRQEPRSTSSVLGRHVHLDDPLALRLDSTTQMILYFVFLARDYPVLNAKKGDMISMSHIQKCSDGYSFVLISPDGNARHYTRDTYKIAHEMQDMLNKFVQ